MFHAPTYALTTTDALIDALTDHAHTQSACIEGARETSTAYGMPFHTPRPASSSGRSHDLALRDPRCLIFRCVVFLHLPDISVHTMLARISENKNNIQQLWQGWQLTYGTANTLYEPGICKFRNADTGKKCSLFWYCLVWNIIKNRDPGIYHTVVSVSTQVD